MTFADSKQRFSNRVQDYVRYRPSYPAAVLEFLGEHCGLHRERVIADIGSGTGLLSKLFVENGNHVYGVEPNPEMKAAGDEFLHSYPNFASVSGSAEATGLADHSIDLVTAGQAFHWFDRVLCRKEFARILKPGGWVVVVSNERLTDSTAFLRDYEALLHRFGTDYGRVAETYPQAKDMLAFFGAPDFLQKSVPNQQEFNLEGLSGRLRSSSYVPAPEEPNHAQMMNELKHVFNAYQRDGMVRFDYRTQIYAGNLDARGTGA